MMVVVFQFFGQIPAKPRHFIVLATVLRAMTSPSGLSLKRCFRPDALDVGLAGKVP